MIFPAQIVSEVDGTVWNEYDAVNVLGAITCADLEHSQYSELMSDSLMFDELVVDAEKVKGALLFRLE